jgi:hypothetical protein
MPPASPGVEAECEMRRLLAAVAVVAAAVAAAGTPARAAGGDYGFDGGTARQQAQVRAALAASSFDWDVVPRRVTIHIAAGTDSYATPGEIWLDADLLDAGRFAWGVVQHEYAHQVDFLVLDDSERSELEALFGTTAWCGPENAAHDGYGCERFADTLAAAYWRSDDNVARAFAAPHAFRALLARMLGGGDRSLASARAGQATRHR